MCKTNIETAVWLLNFCQACLQASKHIAYLLSVPLHRSRCLLLGQLVGWHAHHQATGAPRQTGVVKGLLKGSLRGYAGATAYLLTACCIAFALLEPRNPLGGAVANCPPLSSIPMLGLGRC